jgi:hypothetical protein
MSQSPPSSWLIVPVVLGQVVDAAVIEIPYLTDS